MPLGVIAERPRRGSPIASELLNPSVVVVDMNHVIAEALRLSIEKTFVIIGGGGLGLLCYGLIWRKPPAGVEPIPFNAYRFQHSAGKLRLGIILAAIGWLGAAVVYLL